VTPLPSLALSPGSGPKLTAVVIRGSNLVPGKMVTVNYMNKSKLTQMCTATVADDGTFSCTGWIPRGNRGGRRGRHTIVATQSGDSPVRSSFTVTRRVKHR
jgi:hypothetical protein